MSKSITSQHDGVCIESSKTGVHFLSGSCGSGGLEHYGKAFNQSSANMYNTILKKKTKSKSFKVYIGTPSFKPVPKGASIKSSAGQYAWTLSAPWSRRLRC